MAIEQKIKPNKDKLDLKPITFDVAGNNPNVAEQKKQAAQNIPTVYYYGIQLPSQAIKKIVIDSNKFMPLAYICFDDVYNLLQGPGFPADNAKFSVVLPSNSDFLGQIFLEFKVTKYELETKRGKSVKRIHFWGILNIENLLTSKYKEYPNKSTYDVITDICNESGLGLQSNIDSTNDKQNWNNFGIESYNFIQDIIHKAWNGESSFLWGFVDLYYNINYIDIEKSMAQNINDIKWYITTMITSNVDSNRNIDKNKKGPPQLTNDVTLRNTNGYFAGEKVVNQSTDISLKRGYIRNVHYYDIDGNWSKKAGKYKIYGLDTITTPGTSNQSLILKGDPGSTKFYTDNSKNYYMGKIDTKNMHPDFLWATMQNSENLNDLQKISMQIVLPIPNFNIRRFEKLKLIFTSNAISANRQQSSSKLSGEWLVTGITFEWDSLALIQKVNIVKREIDV